MERFSGSKFNQLLAVIILLLLIIFPLFLVIIEGFIPNESNTFFDNILALFSSSNLDILFNSIKLGFAVVILSTVLALPLSFIMTKTSLRRHNWLDILIMVPFMTPPYIGAMGWMLTMQNNGLLHQISDIFVHITPYFYSFYGMVIVMSCHLTPFLYVILKNTLRNIQKSQEDASEIYGGRLFYKIRKIFTPLVVSGYSMGALLVFVKTIGEFGTPVTMGYQIGYYVLTSEIHRAATVWPIDFQKAALLSTLLLTTSMMIWMFQQWFQQRTLVHQTAGKGNQIKFLPKSKKDIIYYIIVGIILIPLIALPYSSIISNAFMERLSGGFSFDNLTFNNFITVLSGDGGLALLNSVVLALVSATIASILGLYFVMASLRKNKVSSVIDFSSLLPNTVPGIIVVIGLILFWNHTNNPLPFYNTPIMLIVTYVILYIPFSVQNIKNVKSNISDSLIEAASISNDGKWTIFRKIVLPLLLPGIISGWILIFTISMRELVGSLMLRPPNMHTSSTYIYNQFQQGSSSYGMAMALMSVGITTIILIIMDVYNRKKQTQN